MKRFFWIIGVLICMPLAACDDNNPETTDSAVVYTAEGSVNAGDVEKSITLYTTCDWTAAGDEWITVEPAGGSRGIFAVRLSFGANGTGSPRTGTVTFTAGSCKDASQQAIPALSYIFSSFFDRRCSNGDRPNCFLKTDANLL